MEKGPRYGFHQAKWDEPIVFELSRKGERGLLIPEAGSNMKEEVKEPWSSLPKSMVRKTLPVLPEMSQAKVLRHYLRLSQATLGADLNIEIGQGTCTMKYSPKVNERFVRSHKVSELHPLQDEKTVQGILEILYRTELYLREISGLDRFSFQAGGGSQADFAIASVIKAYHDFKGQGQQRDEIITTVFSHPSNAAAAAVKGFKIITVYPDEDGYPDIDALKGAVSSRTAGLMITNPEDTGVFNPRIKEFTEIVHQAGGLCSYDQANANGVLGITRAKEAGFDLCFFNLHKTFSSPHGCGGPGAGAMGATLELKKFLPVPLVDFHGQQYTLNYDLPHSIGKVRMFYGGVPAIVRAYSWIRSLGAEGLKTVAQIAVLNSNYIMSKVKRIKGVGVPYTPGKPRFEQVRYSLDRLYRDTGVTSEDVQRRMCDFGLHYWTSHHPWLVPQPFTLEPTESYSKDELDEYVSTLKQVSNEAYENPEIVKNAPHRSVVHKIHQEWFDDPKKWAITWRMFLQKHGGA